MSIYLFRGFDPRRCKGSPRVRPEACNPATGRAARAIPRTLRGERLSPPENHPPAGPRPTSLIIFRVGILLFRVDRYIGTTLLKGYLQAHQMLPELRPTTKSGVHATQDVGGLPIILRYVRSVLPAWPAPSLFSAFLPS